MEQFGTKGEIAYQTDNAFDAEGEQPRKSVAEGLKGVQTVDRQTELLELYRAHRGALVNFVFSIVKDRVLAEDIVQDTFIRFNGLEDTSVVTHKRAFLYRMASNLSVDRLRQEKRRRTYSVSDTSERGLEENYLVSEAPSPEQVVAARQQLRKLVRLVDGLPPRCAEAFRLFRFEDMTYKEVAKKLDISQSMVEKHISRALRELRDHFRTEDI